MVTTKDWKAERDRPVRRGGLWTDTVYRFCSKQNYFSLKIGLDCRRTISSNQVSVQSGSDGSLFGFQYKQFFFFLNSSADKFFQPLTLLSVIVLAPLPTTLFTVKDGWRPNGSGGRRQLFLGCYSGRRVL